MCPRERVLTPSAEQNATSIIKEAPCRLNRNVSRSTLFALKRRKRGKDPLKPRSRSTGTTCSANAAIILSRALDTTMMVVDRMGRQQAVRVRDRSPSNRSLAAQGQRHHSYLYVNRVGWLPSVERVLVFTRNCSEAGRPGIRSQPSQRRTATGNLPVPKLVTGLRGPVS